ncbi:MAG: type II toxin-antitoxin system VapC family toxin [Nitrososphaerales archaeon]
MKYLFDASSLFKLVRSTDQGAKARALDQTSIIQLTFYEIGNALWKETELKETISKDDANILIRDFINILSWVDIVGANPSDLSEIIKIAGNEKLSFYDSSYLHTAKSLNMILVTEDKELAKAAKNHVETKSLSDVIRDINSQES